MALRNNHSASWTVAMARILVVDDHPNLVKSLYLGLRREGFEVETALNGVAAFELAKRMAFDWIVTDLDMPQICGEVLVDRIREFQPDIKVIMTSFYKMTVVKRPSLFLQKPFLFDELLTLLGAFKE